MINYFRNLVSKLFQPKFIPINGVLIGKDNLFRMEFDEHWYYNVYGNSFYSIHNEIEDLKGGIQISIIWDRPVVESIPDLDYLESVIRENEKAFTTRVSISNMESFYYKINYSDSNMNFYIWYLRFDNVYVKISYFIFEEEPLEIQHYWLQRSQKIIDTFTLNRKLFRNVKMK